MDQVGCLQLVWLVITKLKTLVIENQPIADGQITKFYPHKLIKDFPGFTQIKGIDYVNSIIRTTSKLPKS